MFYFVFCLNLCNFALVSSHKQGLILCVCDVTLFSLFCESFYVLEFMSRYILSPFVWLRRFRNRCGYGVHSPFAFDFLTYVVYERSAYYAYRELNAWHSGWVNALRLRPRKLGRLLFRLANFAEAKTGWLLGTVAWEEAYIQAAVPSCQIVRSLREGQSTRFDFIYIGEGCSLFKDKETKTSSEEVLACVSCLLEKVHEGTLLVIGGLQEHLVLWKSLQQDKRTVLTFDLYDVGVVMFRSCLHRMNYLVNF